MQQQPDSPETPRPKRAITLREGDDRAYHATEEVVVSVPKGSGGKQRGVLRRLAFDEKTGSYMHEIKGDNGEIIKLSEVELREWNPDLGEISFEFREMPSKFNNIKEVREDARQRLEKHFGGRNS